MGQVALVVDDDLDTRTGVAELLRAEGFTVEVAADGRQAYALLERGFRPNVIVLDVRLPGTDGPTFLDKSAALRDGATVIVMTAMPNYDRIRERTDVTAILEKPFEPDELVRLAREACTRV